MYGATYLGQYQADSATVSLRIVCRGGARLTATPIVSYQANAQSSGGAQVTAHGRQTGFAQTIQPGGGSTASLVKAFVGGSWQAKPVKVWDGTSWSA